MNLMKMNFAKVERRAVANAMRERRQKRWVFIGKLMMWVGVAWLVVFLLALVSGCGEWNDLQIEQQKIKHELRREFNTWAIYRNYRCKNSLVLGMTTQEVYNIWPGEPTKNFETFSASGHFLVWKYGERRDYYTYFQADHYLYFLDNKLVNIIKME